MLTEDEVRMGKVKYLWLGRSNGSFRTEIFVDATGNLLLLLFVLFTLALRYNRVIGSVNKFSIGVSGKENIPALLRAGASSSLSLYSP